MRLPKPTYANVCSTLALVLAASGTGYAAVALTPGSVGSRELRDNSVRSVDVQDRTLRATDFARGVLKRGTTGPRGPQGPRGLTGPEGPAGTEGPTGRQGPVGVPGRPGVQGAQGPPGRNASEPLQPGETVFGVLGGEALSTTSASGLQSWISLPAPAPVALDGDHVGIAPGATPGAAGDEDPECTGSVAAPAAPAGKVCIYLVQHDPAQCTNEAGFVAPELGRYGFVFRFQLEGMSGSCLVQAVWAYTAP
jgi:hypothetical protein